MVLTALLLLTHLFLHDYNFVNNPANDRLTGTLSLGSAVLAAVIVASFLPSELDVFAQVSQMCEVCE